MVAPDDHDRWRWLRSTVAGTARVLATLVGAAAAWGWLLSLSEFSKRMPRPALEQVVLSGTGASGTVIDCDGGWYNDGTPTTGSSIDDRDFAADNSVSEYDFDAPTSRAIRDEGTRNKVTP